MSKTPERRLKPRLKPAPTELPRRYNGSGSVMNRDKRDDLLLHPQPGTAAARARDFGIDLSLTLSNLRLTPEQRLNRLQRARELLREIEAARRRGPVNARD